jgi:type III secretion protein L
MAFILPRDALTPARSLAVSPAPHARIMRAHELAAFRQAEQIVADAQAQADAIVAGAQAAFEAERERGYQEGLERARLQQAEQMIENVALTVDYFGKIEDRMVSLVMQAVHKIMSDFDDRDRVIATVRNVLSVVRNQKQMTLRLHDSEVELVRARLDDLLAAYPATGYVDVVGDNRLKPGSCILESDIGLVEASMEGQLAALQNAFQRVLGNRM